MIKIVRGTYGFWNGHAVVPKTAADGPFEMEPEKEKRLVDKGVAVYVGKEPEAPVVEPEPVIEEPEAETEEAEEYTLEALQAMKLADLKALAKEYGIEYRVGMKKADFAEIVFVALQVIDDGDEIPDADPADSIV